MKKSDNVVDEKDVREEEKAKRGKKTGLDPTPDSNPDPITGEPGSHPVGVAAGGAGGGAAGAAIGAAVGGPIGAVVGGVVGAVAGGLAGKGAAEVVNPTEENRYWKENYRTRPYYKADREYSSYEPAYRYGWESASRDENRGRQFEDVERQLETEWPKYSDSPESNWSEYREATRDAYDRVQSRARHADVDVKVDRDRDIDNKKDSVWSQTEGNWRQFKGFIKEKWNLLTDDEIEAMEGRRERIVGKIQERYGEQNWSDKTIEHELRTYKTRSKD